MEEKMKIQKIKVENFRLLKDFELDFREDISLIVGKNNCGKTSIMTIMNKLLGSNEVNFSWNDFNLGFQKIFFDKIQNFDQTMDNYNTDGIRLQVFIEYNESDNYANIQNFMMDLDPDNNVIVLEFFYSCKADKFKQLMEDLVTFNITTFAEFSNFMNNNASKYFELQRYSRGFDILSKKTTDSVSGNMKFSEIEKLIKIKSIKANREASNKVNDSSLSVLSQKYYNIQSSGDDLDMSELQTAIQSADKALSDAYNGVEGKLGIFEEVFKSVKRFGSETDIMIQSSISETDLLKNNTTLYYRNDEHHLPESYNGLGYLNLIGMIFEIETIISEFHGKENEKSSDINILFIEEPEAHTHPQLQYVFIKNILQLLNERKIKGSSVIDIQTVVTTHSSHIVSECDFSDVRYLVRNNNSLISKNFQELEDKYESDVQAFKFIKQYLNLNRSELFFTDKAILIEGYTERILLPAMMQKVDIKHRTEEDYFPLLSQNISVIESGAFAHLFRPLIEFLGIKVLIITDIDGVRSKNGKACKSELAKYTSNISLREFFNLPQDDTQFNTLLNKTFAEKIVGENIRISYQTGISQSDSVIYQSRSFEDAFICSNLDYIKTNKENFKQGLKNRSKFNDAPLDYYNIADKCIAKKSSFAIEVLYYDGVTDGKKWETPEYIKEGLEWLQK